MAEDTPAPEVAPGAVPDAAVVAPEPAPQPEAPATPQPDPAPEAAPDPAPTPPAEPAAPGSAIEGGDAAAATPVPEAPAEPATEAAPEPVAPLAYQPFTMPEGITAEPAQIEAFTTLIGPLQVPQETAQSLMDLHADTLKKYADGLAQHQQDVWEQTKAGWRGQIAQEYGNRRDTVVNNAKWAIEQLEPNADRRAAVWDAMKVTGAGDHPAIVGILSAAAQRMRERSAPPPSVPNRGIPTNPADKRYGAEPPR